VKPHKDITTNVSVWQVKHIARVT